MSGQYNEIGENQLYGTPELMYNYIYYANELAKAWFTYVYNPGKEIRFKIGKNWFETTGQFHPRYISASWAMLGIETSTILRDKEGLEIFSNIDLDTAMRDNGGSSILAEVHYLLQSLIAKGQGSHAEVYATFQEIEKYRDWEVYKKTIIGTDIPMEVEKDGHKYYYENAEAMSFPYLKIYETIFRKDQAAFEEAVKIALLKHKEFWRCIKCNAKK